MSDEAGRRHLRVDEFAPLAAVVVVLAAVGALLAATVDARAVPYLVSTLVGLLGGGLAAAFCRRDGRGLATVAGGGTRGATRLRRLAAAGVVSALAPTTALLAAAEAGVPAAVLPAVVAVCGLAWVAGVGLGSALDRPVSLARARAALARVDRPTWGVLALSGTLFVAFSTYTAWLFAAYWMGGSDFGAYVHMFSTTLDGEGLLLHGKYRVSQPQGSYWGGHFSLTLFAFLPLFALVPTPLTLLVAKSAVVAASVPLLWLLARETIGDDTVAGLVVVSYALNPFLWSAWVFDFQEQALLPLLVFGAFLAYRRRRHGAFLVLAALACLTNEFVVAVFAGALVGAAVAAARAGDLRDRGPTLAAAAAVAALVLVVAAAVTARFSVDAGLPYASFAAPFKPFLGTRTGPFELLAVVAADPSLLLAAGTAELTRKLLFFIALLAPVLFLGLNDELSAGALLPYLAFAWLFAGREIYYAFGAHYPFYLLPFLYVGAARVLGRVDLDGSSRVLLRRLFLTVILVNVFAGFAVGADHDLFPVRTDPAHGTVVEAAIEGIPPEASLLTQNDLYPHVATRPRATYVGRPDMFHMYEAAYGPVTPTYVLVDGGLVARENDWSGPVQEAMGDRLGTEYGLLRCEDGVAVYRRGYAGDAAGITRERPGRC